MVPTTGLFKWEEELEKWLGADCLVLDTGVVPIRPADFLIMSYTMLRMRKKDILQVRPQLIVFDECTALINAKTLQAKAGLEVSEGADYVIGLSGTPFLNRHLELFNPMHIIAPDSYPNWYGYASRYTMGKQYHFSGLMNKEDLVRRLSFSMIRRTKKEVLKDLPDMRKIMLPVQIPSENLVEYNAVVDEMLASRNPFPFISRVRHALGRAKMELAAEWAKEFLSSSDEKLVVYCFHLDVMQYLVNQLKVYGSSFINGSLTGKERDKRNKLFQDSQYPRVMVINTAASQIINLHKASNIFFAEREWVPAMEQQGYSRLHRMGQKSSVSVWYLHGINTLDHNLSQVVASKANEFSNIVGADEVALAVQRGVIESLRRERGLDK